MEFVKYPAGLVKESLDERILSIKITSSASIDQFVEAYLSCPDFVLVNLTSSHWKDLQFILLKVKPQTLVSASRLLAVLLNDTFTEELQQHFLEDTLQVVHRVTPEPKVAFYFEKLHTHEICQAAQCLRLPCCTQRTCTHSSFHPPKQWEATKSGEDAFTGVKLLIKTLGHLYPRTPGKFSRSAAWEEGRHRVLTALEFCTGFAELRDEAVLAILNVTGPKGSVVRRIPQLSIEVLPLDSLLQCPADVLLKATQHALELDMPSQRGLSSVLIKRLMLGKVPVPSESVSRFFEKGRLLLILLLVSHCTEDWKSIVNELAVKVTVVPHASKRVKDGGTPAKLEFEIDERRPLFFSHSLLAKELLKTLRQAVYEAQPKMVSLWRGLSDFYNIGQLFSQTEVPEEFQLDIWIFCTLKQRNFQCVIPTNEATHTILQCPKLPKLRRFMPSDWWSESTPVEVVLGYLTVAAVHAVAHAVPLDLDAIINCWVSRELTFLSQHNRTRTLSLQYLLAKLLLINKHFQTATSFTSSESDCSVLQTPKDFQWACETYLPKVTQSHPNPCDKVTTTNLAAHCLNALQLLEQTLTTSHINQLLVLVEECVKLNIIEWTSEVEQCLKKSPKPIRNRVLTYFLVHQQLPQVYFDPGVFYPSLEPHLKHQIAVKHLASQQHAKWFPSMLRSLIDPFQTRVMTKVSFPVLRFFIAQYDLSLTDLVLSLDSHCLSEWLRAVLKRPQFLVDLLATPDTEEFVFAIQFRTQPIDFSAGIHYKELSYFYQQVSLKLRVKSIVFYPNILAELAWTNEKRQFENFERFVGLFKHDNDTHRLSISEIYSPHEQESAFEIISILLLARLGMQRKDFMAWRSAAIFSDWTLEHLEFDSYETYLEARKVACAWFDASEAVLSQVDNSDWEVTPEFIFQIGKRLEQIVAIDQNYTALALSGLSVVIFQHLNDSVFSEYYIHKLISICLRLLTLDRNLMQLVLRYSLEFCEPAALKDSFSAVACLSFEARHFPDVCDRFASILALRPNTEEVKFIGILDYLQKSQSPFLPLYNEEDGTAGQVLAHAISLDFPLVQHTALQMLPLVLEYLTLEDRGRIAKALNTAASYESSRDHIQEIPLKLGQLIDQMSGLIGAVSQQFANVYKPRRATKSIANALSKSEKLYTRSEDFAYSKALQAKKKTILRVAKPTTREDHSTPLVTPPFDRMSSLRTWTCWLIETAEIPAYLPFIPIANFNLECIVTVLPEVFSVLTSFDRYLTQYIADFFRQSSAGHKRLMLKILQNQGAVRLWRQLKLELKIDVLMELGEFPSALQLIEDTVRERLQSTSKKCNWVHFSEREVEHLYQVHKALQHHKYIEAAPIDCQEASNRELVLRLFAEGQFIQLGQFAQSDPTVDAAAWRLGKFTNTVKGVDKDSVVSYLLNALVTKSLEAEVKTVRSYCIAQSKIRSAEYPQAYEHLVLQHAIENISLSLSSSLSQLLSRNEVLENSFEAKEFIGRVNLVLSRLLYPSEDIHTCTVSLIKTSLQHRQLHYAENLLNESLLMYPHVQSAQLKYYGYKIKVRGHQAKKSKIKKFLLGLNEPVLRWKSLVLYVEAYCQDHATLSHQAVGSLEQLFAQPPEEVFDSVRFFIEKAYYTLGDHLDNYSNLETLEPPALLSACVSAICYAKSLKYGHSYATPALTRALSLFFKLNRLPTRAHEQQTELNSLIGQLSLLMEEVAEQAPLCILAQCVHQVASQNSHPSERCRGIVLRILLRLLARHPAQLSWIMFSLKNSSPSEEAKRLIDKTFRLVKSKMSSDAFRRVGRNKRIIDGLLAFGMADVKRAPGKLKTIDFRSGLLCLPTTQNFTPLKYPKTEYLYTGSHPGLPEQPLLITGASDEVIILQSKARPKKIFLEDQFGCKHPFLCKYERRNDLRKEARVTTVIQCGNAILESDPVTSRLGIRLANYSVIPISNECLLIEWLPKTVTLKSLITELWKKSGVELEISHLKPYMAAIPDSFYDPQMWKSVILPRVQPMLHSFFRDCFPDPNEWLQARKTFTRSLAAWSMFGYVIGLGDRHCDNFLLYTDTGEVVCIDLECVFEHGKVLPKPEVVPFRLTPELQDAMGLYKEQGEFIHCCEVILDTLKAHKKVLMSQFESFVSDPLVVQLCNPAIHTADRNPSNTLKIVEAKLSGIKDYNKKEYFKSTRQQVAWLVKEATDFNNLREMYYGWMPWM